MNRNAVAAPAAEIWLSLCRASTNSGCHSSSGWIAQNDLDVPKLVEKIETDYKALYEAEVQKVEALKSEMREIIGRMQNIVK